MEDVNVATSFEQPMIWGRQKVFCVADVPGDRGLISNKYNREVVSGLSYVHGFLNRAS